MQTCAVFVYCILSSTKWTEFIGSVLFFLLLFFLFEALSRLWNMTFSVVSKVIWTYLWCLVHKILDVLLSLLLADCVVRSRVIGDIVFNSRFCPHLVFLYHGSVLFLSWLLLLTFDLGLDAFWHLFIVATVWLTVLGRRDSLAQLFILKGDTLKNSFNFISRRKVDYVRSLPHLKQWNMRRRMRSCSQVDREGLLWRSRGGRRGRILGLGTVRCTCWPSCFSPVLNWKF